MDRKKVIEQLRSFTPGLAAVVVAGCVASSLSGYQAPVYASDKSVKADKTEKDNDKATEKETKAEIQGAKGSFDLADGTYQGTGTGFSGDVTVSVQIKDKSIVAINVISTTDDAAFFNRAKAVIDKIIQSQKLDVDVVSGATYSSNGIINAVKNALTGKKDSGTTGASLSGAATPAAGGSKTVEKVADAAAYKDGTYYGTGTGFAGPLTVKVVINDGKIASIEITKTDDGDSFIQKASGLISNIVSSQSTNVDTVSGATYSSVGIIEAVRDALSQAAVDSSGNSGNAGTNSNQNNKNDGQNNNQNNGNHNSEEIVAGKFPYKDGIYYGTAEGYQGDITVAVVLKNKTITSILVTEEEDDETFFKRALNVVDQIVEQQKTDVDTVSGATYSSKGLIGAVSNALEDAKRITNGQKPLNDKNGSGTDNKDNKDNKETIDITKLDEFIAMAEALKEEDYTPESWAVLQQKLQEAKQLKETLTSDDKQEKVDKASASVNAAISGLVKKGEEEPETVYINGDYTASVECQPDEEEEFDPYEVSLAITVFNDKIISISDVSWSDKSNNWYMKRAMNGASGTKGVVTQVTEAGTLDQIDTISGATCSSKALIDACQTALDSAKR